MWEPGSWSAIISLLGWELLVLDQEGQALQ